jgi:hypothetical protein
MKFTAEHNQTVHETVEIEITAESLEEAEEINRGWDISMGNTDEVKVVETWSNGDYYAAGDPEPKRNHPIKIHPYPHQIEGEHHELSSAAQDAGFEVTTDDDTDEGHSRSVVWNGYDPVAEIIGDYAAILGTENEEVAEAIREMHD